MSFDLNAVFLVLRLEFRIGFDLNSGPIPSSLDAMFERKVDRTWEDRPDEFSLLGGSSPTLGDSVKKPRHTAARTPAVALPPSLPLPPSATHRRTTHALSVDGRPGAQRDDRASRFQWRWSDHSRGPKEDPKTDRGRRPVRTADRRSARSERRSVDPRELLCATRALGLGTQKPIKRQHSQ